MTKRESGAYGRIRRLIAQDRCVILDGGVTTELERIQFENHHISDKDLWGTGALYHAPEAVLEVHRRYVAAGCDVISTSTWGVLHAPEMEARRRVGAESIHWMDIARLGMRLARQVVDEAGKTGQCAVGFSINGDVDNSQRLETVRLLTRVLKEDPPDLILMETLSLIRENLTFPAVEAVLETGIPLWLSFRRCRQGVCSLYGQHWGGPEGDLFGRVARELEKMGLEALLINCLPADHVPGMLPWLRDFTDMPLGVYPNLGRYLDPGWQFDDQVGPKEYARLARQWKEEGAQIVGGCCGVTPEHIAAARKELAAKPDPSCRAARPSPDARPARPVQTPATQRAPQAWEDDTGRNLYPLPFPDIVCETGIFQPTPGSLFSWKYLFRSEIGKGKRCLDVGCGTGILTVQLALNGARQVHGIDVQREAVANMLANAFRNGVSERVTGEVVDLYRYSPDQKYDVIVASLYQMPVNPLAEPAGHRPLDYWGRNLLDQLISFLPDLLEEEGTAYLMQISLLSQLQTEEILARNGLTSKIVDFGFFPFSPIFQQNMEQIGCVERLSDAYHLVLGEDQLILMYLMEITRGGTHEALAREVDSGEAS